MNGERAARRIMRDGAQAAPVSPERARSGLADVIRRGIAYLGGDETAIRGELAEFAGAVERGDAPSFDRLDALFAEGGPLQTASERDGWCQEFLGLAGAYQVETAPLRG